MNLQMVRKKIDLLDSRIVKLLNNRMELALMARRLKTRVEDSKRENEILERIRGNATGLVHGELMEKLYEEILRESKDLQKKDYRLLAFHGEHGSYGEVAAREWNEDLIPMPCTELVDLFEAIQSGLYDFGIVPVENTLGGVVGQINEFLIQADLYVVGAVELPIHHCLLALPGTDHRELRMVYSHSQALAQCRQFLSRNNLEASPYYNTAAAAKMLSENRPKAAAVIASRLCGDLYDLEIIKENIEDFDRNITRFLVLSGKESQEEGEKCSIIFSTEDKAGILFKVLEVFANRNINLTRIESIPKSPGNYAFFLDFIGSDRDENIIGAVEEVKSMTTTFKLMGCYKERTVS